MRSWLVLLGVLLSSPAFAATYYVDPSATGCGGGGCADSNNGSTTGTAWQSLPGARLLDNDGPNAGFKQAAWGSITTSAKIACGDTICLRAGTTYDQGDGGAWLVDRSYYTQNCAANPIEIRVCTNTTTPQWAGATGNFVFNATGMLPTGGTPAICCTSTTCTNACTQDSECTGGATCQPTYCFGDGSGSKPAMITVCGVSGVHLRGASASDRLELHSHASGGAINFQCSSCTASTFWGDRWFIHDGTGAAFNVGVASQVFIENAEVRDLSTQGGMQIGQNFDQRCDNCAFKNVRVTRTGSNPAISTFGDDDGFFMAGSTRFWCIDCIADFGKQRGVNTGVIQNGASVDYNYHYLRPIVYQNGDLCKPTSLFPGNCVGYKNPDGCCTGAGTGCLTFCDGGGIDVSGDEDQTGDFAYTTVMNGLIVRNADLGIKEYAGGRYEVINSFVAGNGWDRTGAPDITYDRTGNQVVLRGNTFYDTATSIMFNWNNSGGPSGTADVKPISFRNIYFGTPNSTSMSTFWFNGNTFTAGGRTFAQSVGFTDPSLDCVGAACDPLPTAIGAGCMTGTCDASCSNSGATCDQHGDCTSCGSVNDPCGGFAYTNCNTAPTGPASVAIDHGSCLVRANGNGSNASTVNVTGDCGAGGCGFSDPRRYFIEPTSFYRADLAISGVAGKGHLFRIGENCTDRRVTSMTATSITFDPACSWNNGDCISYPWQGNAPDALPQESGEVVPTTTSTSSTSSSSTTSTSTTSTTATTSPVPTTSTTTSSSSTTTTTSSTTSTTSASACNTTVVDTTGATQHDGWRFFTVSGVDGTYQCIDNSATAEICEVQIYAWKFPTGATGDFHMEVWNCPSCVPTTQTGSDSNSIAVAGIPSTSTGTTYQTFTFGTRPTPASTYCVIGVLDAALGNCGGGDCYVAWSSSNTNTAHDGTAHDIWRSMVDRDQDATTIIKVGGATPSTTTTTTTVPSGSGGAGGSGVLF